MIRKYSPEIQFEERRSEARQIFEEKPEETSLEIKMQIEQGVQKRIAEIIGDKSTDTKFSRSAKDVFLKEAGNHRDKERVAVVVTEKDPYGKALKNRDSNKIWHEEKIPSGSSIEFIEMPFISIPDTPKDPAEVKVQAEEGKLGFSYMPTKTMAAAVTENGKWQKIQYIPNGDLRIGATSIRYGQAYFGGSFAIANTDENEKVRAFLFRPDMHAKRCVENGQELVMRTKQQDELIEAKKQLLKTNIDYLPPPGKGRLYFAPGFCAKNEHLGVNPNPEYVYTEKVVPIGQIYPEPIRVKFNPDFNRGRFGHVKAAGNYVITFLDKILLEAQGFNDMISMTDEGEVGELRSSNFCGMKKGVLVVPRLNRGILPGVTRDSILVIAQELVEQGLLKGVEERAVFPKELKDFDEAFACGTGVSIQAIESITYYEQSIVENIISKLGLEKMISPMINKMKQNKTAEEFIQKLPLERIVSGARPLIRRLKNTLWGKEITAMMDTSADKMGRCTRLISNRFNDIITGKELDNPRYKDWMVEVEI